MRRWQTLVQMGCEHIIGENYNRINLGISLAFSTAIFGFHSAALQNFAKNIYGYEETVAYLRRRVLEGAVLPPQILCSSAICVRRKIVTF